MLLVVEPDLVIAAFFYLQGTILILKEQYSKVVAWWLKKVFSFGLLTMLPFHSYQIPDVLLLLVTSWAKKYLL